MPGDKLAPAGPTLPDRLCKLLELLIALCLALMVLMVLMVFGNVVAYEALSWGHSVNRMMQAWDLVNAADALNLGMCLDSFRIFAAKDSLEDLDLLVPTRIFLVQLSDFMWQETPTFEERMTTARTFRAFPGEGVHSEELARLVVALDRLGYRGDHSFAVFNDDYQQLPLPVVAERARRAAVWLAEDVLGRSAPLPGAMQLPEMPPQAAPGSGAQR